MEVEKRGSRGGFLQLFDWNAKSRKKLFSNNSELPEGSRQGKENVKDSAMSRLHLMGVDENGGGSSVKESSDCNCGSSVSGDEGYGTRAPGVVARLMGLDSLPTSNVSEPSSTPFFESCSFRDSHYPGSMSNVQIEHHTMDYINMANRMEGFSRNPVESRPQKVKSRPIERFQTEMLPPKSAKSIPITHHKLLSPIKGPGFIPTKNAAYIMEAAAKIIEPGPRATTNGKMPSLGSSLVPLKIRYLKEKMEAAQKVSRLPEASRRPKELSSVKFVKGQPSGKSQSVSEDTTLFKALIDSEKNCSESLKNKGKSISLAIQAKVNVQRREGFTSSSNRSVMKKKEHNEVKLNQIFKSQQSTQKSGQKRTSANRTSNVLRQNNQKQNCVSKKDRLISKTSVPNQQARKAVSVDGSFGPNKTSKKVVLNSEIGSRKMGPVAADTEKELALSKTKNFSRKKRSANGDMQFEESVADNQLHDKDGRHIKCNVAVDGCMNWGADNRKKSMDVVSFTFTSPMIRSLPGSQSSDQIMEKNKNFCVDSYGDIVSPDSNNTRSSSLGLNVIGGDALSVLLERKLKELTNRVESSDCNLFKTGTAASSASSMHDSVSTIDAASTTSMEHDKSFQLGLHTDKSDSLYKFDCSSIDGLVLNANQKWQGLEEVEEHSSTSNNSDVRKEHDCQHPSSVSILEPSFSNESCNSSDSRNSDSTNGIKQCILAQAEEVVNWISTKRFQPEEGETELSDSASSTSTKDVGRKHMTTTISLTDFKPSTNWELEYVRDILCNAELMSQDFALGQAHKFITSNLFDELENQKSELERSGEEYSNLGRKVLFDCVSESLDLRSAWLFGGSCKAWAKWETLFRRKGRLAEELYKEISGWRGMGDLMVDELVDKDMSTQYGRWLDFDIEVFEEGVEIEEVILTSLVDELVDDFFMF